MAATKEAPKDKAPKFITLDMIPLIIEKIVEKVKTVSSERFEAIEQVLAAKMEEIGIMAMKYLETTGIAKIKEEATLQAKQAAERVAESYFNDPSHEEWPLKVVVRMIDPKNIKALPRLVEAITANPRAIRMLAIAVNDDNREFRGRRDTIAEILGPLAEGHDREINNCTRQAMEENIAYEHMGEFVAREQDNGNLPKPLPITETADTLPPVEDAVLPNDRAELLEWLQKAIVPEQFTTHEGEIRTIAANFARRQDKTRTLSQIGQSIKEKFGDIFVQ